LKHTKRQESKLAFLWPRNRVHPVTIKRTTELLMATNVKMMALKLMHGNC
uniref:Ovule protein n=1 Tax=Gongylonema pulchrum TaxID=637853 RepID=A0A183DHK8_9BILA